MININNYIGCNIEGISYVPSKDFIVKNNEIIADRLIINLNDNKSILIGVNEDTDEIVLEFDKVIETNNITNSIDWYNNKRLQMIWRCFNHQGYNDMLVLSFNDLHPNLILLAEGTILKFFQVNRMGNVPN